MSSARKRVHITPTAAEEHLRINTMRMGASTSRSNKALHDTDVDNWSFWLDLLILLETIPAILGECLDLLILGIRISLQNFEKTAVLWKLYLGWHGHVFERLIVRFLALGDALNNYEFWLSWKHPSVEICTLVREFPSRNFGVLIENLVDSETFGLACSR